MTVVSIDTMLSFTFYCGGLHRSVLYSMLYKVAVSYTMTESAKRVGLDLVCNSDDSWRW